MGFNLLSATAEGSRIMCATILEYNEVMVSVCEMSSGEWLIKAQPHQSLVEKREGLKRWQLWPWLETGDHQHRSEKGPEEFSSLELNNSRCSLGTAEVVN